MSLLYKTKIKTNVAVFEDGQSGWWWDGLMVKSPIPGNVVVLGAENLN